MVDVSFAICYNIAITRKETTMTVKELKDVLSELPDDFPIYSIFNGMIDRTPGWNVDDECLYIEGILEEKLPHFA